MTPQWPDAVPANLSIIAPPNQSASSPQRSFAERPAKVNTDNQSARKARVNTDRKDAARGKERASFRRLIEDDSRRPSEASDSRRNENSETTPASRPPASDEVRAEESRLKEEEAPQAGSLAADSPEEENSPGDEVVVPKGGSLVSKSTALTLAAGVDRQTGPEGATADAVFLPEPSKTELDRDLAKLFAFLGGEGAVDVPIPLPSPNAESESASSDLLPNLPGSTKDGLAFLISLSSGGPDALPANGIPVSGIPEGQLSRADSIAAGQTLPLGQGLLASPQASGTADAASPSASDVFPQILVNSDEPVAPLVVPGDQAVGGAGNTSLSEGAAPLASAASLSAAAAANGQPDELNDSDSNPADADITADVSPLKSKRVGSETAPEASESNARSAGAFRSAPSNAVTGNIAGSGLPNAKDLSNLDNIEVVSQANRSSRDQADLSAPLTDASAVSVSGSPTGSRSAAPTAGDFASRITDQISETIITRAATTQVGDSLTLDAILDPPELGRLHFRITRSKAGLRAVVTAENGDVQQVIAQQTTSIEQSVRTALNNDDSMQFQAADTPFSDGTTTAQDHEQRQPPAAFDDRTPVAAEPDKSPRPRKTAQAEIDVLA